MANVNWLGDLRREYHHVKAIRPGDNQPEYEPAMVLLKDGLLDKSAWIPLQCLWKYLEPKDNKDMRAVDAAEFDRMAQKIYWRRKLSVNPVETAEDCAAVVMAEQFNANSGVMLCTAYSLVKVCQLLEIPVSGQSMAQLLMFIQSGLEELKNMPEHVAEEVHSAGEAIVMVNGKRHNVDINLSTSDLVGVE